MEEQEQEQEQDSAMLQAAASCGRVPKIRGRTQQARLSCACFDKHSMWSVGFGVQQCHALDVYNMPLMY